MHGLPFDPQIAETCCEYGIPLIEDVCQAQGAKLQGAPTGTIGDFGAFSFNTRKALPAGLGGALSVAHEHLVHRVVEIRDYGAKCEDGIPLECGSYLPISEFDAALCLAQLPRLQTWIQQANISVKRLREAIPRRFPSMPSDRTHTWHKIRVKGSETERHLLDRNGLLTSRWTLMPLTEYPCYRSVGLRDGSYPGAVDICANTFCLLDDEFPIHAQSEECVEKMAMVLERTLR